MKQLAVALIALSITINVTVPRQLDTMVSDDIVNQAMRCQSVLLYYSFFSVVPIKIMNTLFAGQSDPSAPDASGGKPENNRAPATTDLSMPGNTAVVKPACSQLSSGVKAVGYVPGRGVTGSFVPARWLFCPSGWASVAHQWMIMLPRGSIDDHMQSAVVNLQKPIGIPSQLVFSFGGM